MLGLLHDALGVQEDLGTTYVSVEILPLPPVRCVTSAKSCTLSDRCNFLEKEIIQQSLWKLGVMYVKRYLDTHHDYYYY